MAQPPNKGSQMPKRGRCRAGFEPAALPFISGCVCRSANGTDDLIKAAIRLMLVNNAFSNRVFEERILYAPTSRFFLTMWASC